MITPDSPDQLAYCRQVEAAVIGALLLAPDRLAQIRGWLAPADFATVAYGRWYRIIGELLDAGRPVDPVTLLGELRHRGALDPYGEHAVELFRVARDVPLPANLPHYARQVLEESLRRTVATAGSRLAQAAETPDPHQMLTAGRRALAALAAVQARWQAATGDLRPPAADRDNRATLDRQPEPGCELEIG